MDYLSRLVGVDPRLVVCLSQAVWEFELYTNLTVRITSGVRTLKQQQHLFDTGKTKIVEGSYHLRGMAVDVAIFSKTTGKPIWSLQHYKLLNTYVQRCAALLGLSVTWGGEWAKFPDGPHFQLEDKPLIHASPI